MPDATVQIVTESGNVVVRGRGAAGGLRWELEPDEAEELASDIETAAEKARGSG